MLGTRHQGARRTSSASGAAWDVSPAAVTATGSPEATCAWALVEQALPCCRQMSTVKWRCVAAAVPAEVPRTASALGRRANGGSARLRAPAAASVTRSPEAACRWALSWQSLPCTKAVTHNTWQLRPHPAPRGGFCIARPRRAGGASMWTKSFGESWLAWWIVGARWGQDVEETLGVPAMAASTGSPEATCGWALRQSLP